MAAMAMAAMVSKLPLQWRIPSLGAEHWQRRAYQLPVVPDLAATGHAVSCHILSHRENCGFRHSRLGDGASFSWHGSEMAGPKLF